MIFIQYISLLFVALLLSSCGSNKYVGPYKNGLEHGQGIMEYSYGNKYVGGFAQGLRHGQGVMDYVGGKSISGSWANGLRFGKGTLIFANGDKCIGHFNDGMHGKASCFFSNGKRFTGTLFYAAPDNAEGTYFANNRDPNKGYVTGVWRDGVFITPKQARVNKAEFKSIRRSAERGNVNAQYNLGKIYHEALLGVLKDNKEALKWYRLAAKQGDLDSQNYLGMLYPVEEQAWKPIKMSKGEAVKWLIKAAVQGDNGARNRLVDIAPAAVDEVIRIQEMNTMNKAKAQCADLGFTQGTDKHADCAVRMFSTARADQRMKQQVKENRAETDRLIQESKTESYRRTLEQARLQRADVDEQKRQRDRDTGLRMMDLGAKMMQGNTGSKSNKIRCTSQSFGADLSQIDCQ
jgi:hypothetical protein